MSTCAIVVIRQRLTYVVLDSDVEIYAECRVPSSPGWGEQRHAYVIRELARKFTRHASLLSVDHDNDRLPAGPVIIASV